MAPSVAPNRHWSGRLVREASTFRFSGPAYPKLSRDLRACGAVAGRCRLRLVTVVTVTVDSRLSPCLCCSNTARLGSNRQPDITALCLAFGLDGGNEILMSVDDRVSGYYGEERWPRGAVPYGCRDMTSGQGRGCAAPRCWPVPYGCADITSGQGRGCGEGCWPRGAVPYGCPDMTSGQGRGCAAPRCWPVPYGCADITSGQGRGCGEGCWPRGAVPYGCPDMTSGQGRGCAAPRCWPVPYGCADITSGQGRGCGEGCWLRGMMFSFDAAQRLPKVYRGTIDLSTRPYDRELSLGAPLDRVGSCQWRRCQGGQGHLTPAEWEYVHQLVAEAFGRALSTRSGHRLVHLDGDPSHNKIIWGTWLTGAGSDPRRAAPLKAR